MAELHRTGKHFVDKELLALLDQVRAETTVPAAGGTAVPVAKGHTPIGLLRDFLDVTLDKWDGRYDYRSYLALNLLPMTTAPEPDGAGAEVDLTEPRRQRDRLFLQLIADILAFELAAQTGTTDLLPMHRPAASLVTKRYRLGLRATSPVLTRIGLCIPDTAADPAAAATALHAVALADQTAAERTALGVSLLPVYVMHDEYLFIRVLQAYECTFASLAVELHATISALSEGLAHLAAERLAYAREQLDLAAPLFSLLATMQPDSFRTFRVYTEGASAIQSRSYKLVESLCRLPEDSRLASAAYRAAPEIRERVLAGQLSVDQAYQSAIRAGRLTKSEQHLIEQRMREFATALLQWRQTHYRLATRMLGTTRPGTGYTEGTPYLAAIRSIPVFTTVAQDSPPARTDWRLNQVSEPDPEPVVDGTRQLDDDSRAALRAQFPLLQTCVYLNSNSTGAVPQAAQNVLTHYWETLRTWRDDVWMGWHDGLQRYADGIATFIGAPPGSVITDANLSTLLARVASCFDYRAPRNRVVTTNLEFPTVPFIWQAYGRYGAQLDMVDSGGPQFDEDALEKRIDERTLLVCVPHASYSSGATIDLSRLVTRAHDVGALVVVDAFQSVGVMPLDVAALGVDFVLGGAHKWLCGVGTAFLYVRPELLPVLEPAATGWQAGDRALTFQPSTGWAAGAQRFAGGTPFPLTSLVSQAGLDLLTGLGIDAIRAHSLACTERILTRAEAAGIPVVSPVEPHRRGGVMCLDVPDGEAVKRRLAERNLICSWRRYLRVGPHVYNTLDEIDEFMDALEQEWRGIRR
ncbi:aminotransferase class V-fold PLP-dependent enzyme [Micromonospora polyrhachis]|uniref:Selenocysteine lyase/cysteine desulfurase/tryptophan 2,3-dioxygenase n=1 Tax=Micromonospora polyrhachis TaxID=1282883 RepID=A0A7W7WTA3_9ACTN|nr:selenocysteine lyase/cysteine desulfurase/tryptophan 2,3-dioxygenase [Micromonospora polyrhachis]